MNVLKIEEAKSIFDDLYQKQKIELINDVGQDKRLGDLALGFDSSERLIRKLARAQMIHEFSEIMLVDAHAKGFLSGLDEEQLERAYVFLTEDKSIIDKFECCSYAEAFLAFKHKVKEKIIRQYDSRS